MRTGYLALISLALFLLNSASAADTQDYPVGYGALEVFHVSPDLVVPPQIMAWLWTLVFSFGTGLFFVWRQPIARWLVGGYILGFLAHQYPFHVEAMGLPMLAGMISLHHLVLWAPGFYLLLKERPFINGQGLFRIWSGWITIVIIISFFFDIRDSAIYLNHVLGLGMLS